MNLKIKPIYLIIAAIAAVLFIYFALPEQASIKTETSVATATESNQQIDLAQLSTEAKKNINPTFVEKITALETKYKTCSSSEKPAVVLSLLNTWDSAGSRIITAQYAKEYALITRNPKDLFNASEKLVNAFTTAADTNLAVILGNEANELSEMAVAADSSNIDAKVNLAICKITNQGKIMDGVQILLSIVKKDPNHLKANFILGKFAAVSTQWDKAITRLEHVISLDKNYTDAYLELAKAYKGKGDSAKAKQVLEQCKNTVTSEVAKKEIQELINNI